MYLDLEIRGHVLSYLSGETTLRDFRAWYIPATWDVNTRRNGRVESLVNEIDLRLAEFTSGHWTEDELKEVLSRLTKDYEGVVFVTAEGHVIANPPYIIWFKAEAADSTT